MGGGCGGGGVGGGGSLALSEILRMPIRPYFKFRDRAKHRRIVPDDCTGRRIFALGNR